MPVRRAIVFRIGLVAAVVLVFSVGISLVSPSASVSAQTAAVRIMPLGDSITTHTGSYNSYRRMLWQSLRNAGYNVDFTGSRQVNDQNQYPPNRDFDLDYEGHPGWRVDNLQGSIRAWMDAQRPQIVLLHAGTNDLIQGQSVDSTINDLSYLIDTMRASNPSVTILMAKIIPFNRTHGELVPTLNTRIASLAATKTTSQSRIIVVDQYSGFNVSTDTYDSVHPNVSGETKLANRWYQALQTVLTTSGTQPTATRTPTPVPTTAPTQVPSSSGLYRAINLAGSGVTINGEAWQAYPAANFSAAVDGGSYCWSNPVFNPSVDINRFNMLRCSVYGGHMTLTMSGVPNGRYNVYLWIWEDNNSVTTDIRVQGTLVHAGYATGSAGTWRRLGPWSAQASSGTITLRTSGSWVNLSGFEVRYGT